MIRLIVRELRDHKWSLVAFSLGSLVMLWLYVATFRSSQASSEQLKDLVKNYPKGFLEAFGLNDLSPDTIEKYLNAKHFSFLWPLLATILMLSRAGTQVAGEIQNGTMGLLLAMPRKRWEILASKYCAGIITAAFFSVVSIFSVIPLAAAYGIPTHLNVLLSTWILCLLFMTAIYSLAFAVSGTVSSTGKVTSVTGGFLVISYAAHIAALITESLTLLKFVSVFYYFDTATVLATGHIAFRSLLVFGVLIIAGACFGVYRFNKRDIFV